MKVSRFNQWISLGLLLGVSGPCGSAFAMGKAKDPSQDPLYQQELNHISQNQTEIDGITQKMNWVPDHFAIPQNATLAQLQDIDRAQMDAIRSLTQQQIEKNEETSEDIKKLEAQIIGSDEYMKTNDWVEGRCTALGDSVSAPYVPPRTAWAKKCLKAHQDDLLAKRVKLQQDSETIDPDLEAEYFYTQKSLELVANNAGHSWTPGRYWYPVFGQADPKDGTPWNIDKSGKFDSTESVHFVAPVNDSDGCNVSYNGTSDGTQGKRYAVDLLNDLDFKVVAMCVSGCLTPEQKLAFQGGYQAIGAAFENGTREILALSSKSTMDHVEFEPAEIKAYTIDIAPSWQEVIDLETLSGKKLTVTKNHPILDSDGKMLQAQDLKVGMTLMSGDGTSDPLVSTVTRNYYGKVYNVRLDTEDPMQNIVIAEGLMTGTVYFQDEGTKDLNRTLFRMNIPKELF